MNLKDLIIYLRDIVDNVRKDGVENISTVGLLNLFKDIEDDIELGKIPSEIPGPSQIDIEYLKMKHISDLAHYNIVNNAIMSHAKSVIDIGQAALKSAILINGGASVALLAFMGHIWNSSLCQNMLPVLPASLLRFLIGVLAAAVASGTTYLSMYSYGLFLMNNKKIWKNAGDIINILTILLVVFSYLLFILGGLKTYCAFIAH